MYYGINNNGRNFISKTYRRNTVLMSKYRPQQVNNSSTLLLNKTANPKKIEAKFNYPACEELSFKGNVIDIKQGHNYSVKTLLHGSTQVSVERNRSRLLFNKLNPTAEVSDYFTEAQYTDMAKTNTLINFLSKEGTVAERLDLIRTFLPDYKDASARLINMGIEPDKYFEIKGGDEKLFIDSVSGWTYTQTEIENLNKSYNKSDYRKLGYTKESTFTIDGHDYHMDDEGHLSIPSNAICIPTRVTIKK